MTITDKQIDAALRGFYQMPGDYPLKIRADVRAHMRAALEAAASVAADAAQAVAWCAPWQLDLVASLSVGQFASMELAKHESARFNTALYATPPPPADDARDGGRILLRQAIDAMSKLRQSLEFPGKHGGLYVFPEHAVRKFTDEQARIMYEENRLAGAMGAQGGGE